MNLYIHLTTDDLKAVAFVTVFIILFALAFGVHPFKRKPEFMSPKLWDASEYYIYLKHNIGKCVAMTQLNEVRPLIKKFLKHYRKGTDPEELQRYYSRLMNAITEKEKELNAQLQTAPV